MLNGIAPLLIFYFPEKVTASSVDPLTGLPVESSTSNIGLPFGLPLPIYLDENLTGILVSNESKSLDIDTNSQQTKKRGAIVTQRGVSSVVSVDLVAKKDSFLLSALLAFSDMIFQRVVSKEYSVSYFNGPIALFNGLLHGLTTSADPDNTLIRINLQISKANDATPQETFTTPTVQKVPGTVLGPTGVTP